MIEARYHLSITEDRFSLDRLSVLHAGFFLGFLKNSDMVNEFLGNVRTNDFCAKLVVCSWAFTEDLISLDGSSIFASRLLLDFLKNWVSQGLHLSASSART